MQCPTCNTDLPSGQMVCPHCGTSVGAQAEMATLWVIATVVVAALIMLGGSLAYMIAHQGGSSTAQVEEDDDDSATDYTEVAVVHGGVVRPEELEGHGHLYFVSIGRQAIPVDSLADYYRKKFNIEITVLPEVPLES